jgi:hypothetical protein
MSEQPPYGDQGNAGGGDPPSYPGRGPGGLTPEPNSAGGFFQALFDFKFESFVTPKIVKFVYIVGTVLIGIWLVVAVIGGVAGLATGNAAGILVLILGPIGAVIFLALFRMMLEVYFAIVRMSEDIHHGRGRAA